MDDSLSCAGAFWTTRQTRLSMTDKSEICVVPCGTDLGIFDLKWLDDSTPVPKGCRERLRPFADFGDWESIDQLRNHRDLVRNSLPSQYATGHWRVLGWRLSNTTPWPWNSLVEHPHQSNT